MLILFVVLAAVYLLGFGWFMRDCWEHDWSVLAILLTVVWPLIVAFGLAVGAVFGAWYVFTGKKIW